MANPVATFWTAAMMLERLGEYAAGRRPMATVERVCADGVLTAYAGGAATTAEATEAVCAANHLCGMLLQSAAGAKLTGVVFRCSGPAITGMMAGRIDVFCDQATNTAPFLRDGRVEGFAATLPQRVPGLDLPTTAEHAR